MREARREVAQLPGWVLRRGGGSPGADLLGTGGVVLGGSPLLWVGWDY